MLFSEELNLTYEEEGRLIPRFSFFLTYPSSNIRILIKETIFERKIGKEKSTRGYYEPAQVVTEMLKCQFSGI